GYSRTTKGISEGSLAHFGGVRYGDRKRVPAREYRPTSLLPRILHVRPFSATSHMRGRAMMPAILVDYAPLLVGLPRLDRGPWFQRGQVGKVWLMPCISNQTIVPDALPLLPQPR